MKNHLVGLIVLIFSVNKHAPAGFLVENVLEWRARLVCPECGSRNVDMMATGIEQ
jgi:hypothetical protein